MSPILGSAIPKPVFDNFYNNISPSGLKSSKFYINIGVGSLLASSFLLLAIIVSALRA